MEHHSYKDLTKDQRWKIAEKLAEDRLEAINDRLEEVIIPRTFYARCGKRLLDIIVGFIACVICLPINIMIGVITLLDVGRPIFFTQKRTGKDGQNFTILKFRNMKIAYDERGEMLPADQRVTKWGKFVRKTSLDELLNFWSVLKGDMSIIGPRPLPPEYLVRYNKRHRTRLAVRPGLECPPWKPTDHAWTWQEHLDNDVWYVEHLSLKTDIFMCFKLVQYAFDKKSTLARSQATTGTFEGYSEDGVAITVEEIPQDYIDWVFDRTK